jgi:sugar/nucleoside kinase (ribokinase family)
MSSVLPLAVAIAEGASVRSASEWACKVASLSVTRPGTIPAFSLRAEADREVGPLNPHPITAHGA